MHIPPQQGRQRPAQFRPLAGQPDAICVRDAEIGEFYILGKMPAQTADGDFCPGKLVDFCRSKLPACVGVEPDDGARQRE